MTGTMRAIVKEKPEPGAVYRNDVPIPSIGDNDVLVKVKATAICGTDQHILPWSPWAQARLKLPMVFGHEMSGEVVEVGSAVRRYKPGDRVAVETHIPCKACYQCQTGNEHICENMKIIGVHAAGVFSDYAAIPQDCIWKLDDSIDYDIGAMLEPMGVAVHGVFAGEIGNKTTLILGCGPIGAMAVGAAKKAGASKVFVVDIFDDKLALGKTMGADFTYNSKKVDYVAEVLKETEGRGAEVVIDYTGNSKVVAEAFKALCLGGRFTIVGLANDKLELDSTSAIVYKEAKVNGVTGRLMYQTWWQCTSLLKNGLDITPVIGGKYAMKDYEQAFDALKAGAPGKMLLIP